MAPRETLDGIHHGPRDRDSPRGTRPGGTPPPCKYTSGHARGCSTRPNRSPEKTPSGIRCTSRDDPIRLSPAWEPRCQALPPSSTCGPPMVTRSPACSVTVARSVFRLAKRSESSTMARGRFLNAANARETVRRGDFRFKRLSRCNSASASASVSTAGLPDAIALHLGVRKFLAADVLRTTYGILARHDLGNEARLGFPNRLPHVGVERSPPSRYR